MFFTSRREIMVCGVMRSGTNLAKHIITGHSRCTVVFNKYWWKHAPFPFLQRPGERYDHKRFAVIIKDPIHWTRSIYNYYASKSAYGVDGKDYSDFIRSPFVLKDDSKYSISPAYRFENPLSYYNQFYLSYLSVEARLNIKLLRYEDMAQNPEAFLEQMVLPKERLPGAVTVPEQPVRPSSDRRKTKFDEGQPSAYPEVSKADFDFISAETDTDLLMRFHYLEHRPAPARRLEVVRNAARV
ncbi:hypothetical protein [Rhizobium paknamense]|uniref:Sulfotransferase family protein n=1 Tax=Rhizobium paknamense TaxID=1206817 RepID=A0ABU0I9I9_9HYPH|nr:hypothetical protein [Rhizobium paknamense]MDQ0454357.1 hypothetical protein [Rhizobium paknamense]